MTRSDVKCYGVGVSIAALVSPRAVWGLRMTFEMAPYGNRMATARDPPKGMGFAVVREERFNGGRST